MQQLPNASAGLTAHMPLLLAGLAALVSVTTHIILIVFPEVIGALGTSVKDLNSTLASFVAAFAVGQLFVGPLSDGFGRKSRSRALT